MSVIDLLMCLSRVTIDSLSEKATAQTSLQFSWHMHVVAQWFFSAVYPGQHWFWYQDNHIASGNGVLTDGINLLSELMLLYFDYTEI